MAGFCYFFRQDKNPFSDGVNEGLLESMGLESLSGLKKPVDDYVVHETSLEGQVGTWIYPKPLSQEDPPSSGVKPDQKWLDREGFWIGWWPEHRPRPEDLSREPQDLLLGYKLHYQDEVGVDTWVLPVIRSNRGGSTLKMCYAYDSQMNLVAKPKPRDRKLWQKAGEIFGLLESGGYADPDQQMSNEELVSACFMFLGVNYRVGPHEATAFYDLGYDMFDTEWVQSVLHAATDYVIWQEFQKKRDPLTESSSSENTGNGSPTKSSEKPVDHTAETCA